MRCSPVAALAFVAASVFAPVAARADEPTEWSARHILIAWKSPKFPQVARSKEEAHALAEKSLAEIKGGADFEEVSHRVSDDKVSDTQGGFLMIFGRGVMAPEFQAAVEALKVGELSGIVESPFGYHLIQRISLADAMKRLESISATFGAVIFSYKGSRDQHAVRAKDVAQQQAVQAAEFLRKGGSFRNLPGELDAKPMRPGGGSFTLRKGQVLPQFKALEDNGFALKLGEYSDPFDTPAGWMILYRKPWFRMHVQHLIVMYAGGPATPPGITRSKAEAQARAEEALKKLEADPSLWAKIVAEYSDEGRAAERQGDLGVIEAGNGKVVVEFEDGIAGLTPGSLSKVFPSEFGFHVARRIE